MEDEYIASVKPRSYSKQRLLAGLPTIILLSLAQLVTGGGWWEAEDEYSGKELNIILLEQ